ncbi:MAG: permease [Candidatus Margulisbacteria bacterium]|nr:permease [Candidatus Margulisiibacteriota bacterium]
MKKDKHLDPICGMSVDENSSYQITWQSKKYYFCSENCLKKFKEQKGIKDTKKEIACESCAPTKKLNWWKNKIFLVTAAYLAVFILGKYISFFAPLSNSLFMYVKNIFLAVALGLFIGGIIDWAIPREYISKILAGKKKRTVFYAVITGFLMSACSHGILALSIQLYKKGASPSAVVAFLLASPWANLPLTILMFGFFGVKAFLIVFSAIVIALISGFIFMLLESKSLVEENPNTVLVEQSFSIRKDIKERMSKIKISFNNFIKALKAIFDGSVSLANMVLWWIMLGMLFASIAAAYLPENFMHNYMGATFLGLLVTLGIATIMEVCSEGTAPLAFEIFRQTGALGNSFVFLMAGVVTDYTEIGLLWTNVGRKTAIWMPIIAVPQVIVLGYIFNTIFS